MSQILNQVSDKELKQEYNKRFFLKKGDKVNGSKEAADHFISLFIDKQVIEQFAVIYLNAANRIITSGIMFKGSLTSSAVYPREIIKRALELNAVSIIISHNHPSGEIRPSQEDINITSKIKDACNTVDIVLHDHIIVAGTDYFSFSDEGVL